MSEAPRVQLYLQDRLLAEVPFGGDALRIGRMKENDLVVNNLAVSRFHAVVRRDGLTFEIEDLGSENGTFVAGQRVRGVTPFAVDQAVGVGQHMIVVRSAGGVSDACEEADVIEDVTVVDENFADFPTATAAAGTETSPGIAPVSGSDVASDVASGDTASDLSGLGASAEDQAQEALDAPFAAAEMDHAVAEAELLAERPPSVTESPDPGGAFDFGEEDIATDDADVDLVDLDLDGPGVVDPLAEDATVASPSSRPGEHTALFDFGLNEDLASSDPSLLPPTPTPEPTVAPAEDEELRVEPVETAPEIHLDFVPAEAEARPADDSESIAEPEPEPEPEPEEEDSLLLAETPVASPELLTEELTEPPVPEAEEHAGLIVQRGGQLERVVAWSGEAMVAGRGKECEVPLPDPDVSRRHASFERTESGYRVVDLGSINGVRVNGERRDVHVLEVGDVVGIGDFELTFVIDRQPVGEGIRLPEPSPRVDVDVREQTMLAGWDEESAGVQPEQPAPTHLDLADPLAEEEEGDDEKELERSLSAAVISEDDVVSSSAAPIRLEVVLPADRMPEAVRAALEALGEDDVVVTAEVRFRIG